MSTLPHLLPPTPHCSHDHSRTAMLCEKCKKVLQASATRWGTYPGKDVPSEVKECLSASPLHFSLRSFYRSISTGCYACRQLWATILERPGISLQGRETSTAPFLSDPARVIPSSLGGFRREFSEHASTATSWLSHLFHENIVAKQFSSQQPGPFELRF